MFPSVSGHLYPASRYEIRPLALCNGLRKAYSMLSLHLNWCVQNKNWAWVTMFMFFLLGVLASSLTFLFAKHYWKKLFLGNESGLLLGRLEVDTTVQVHGLHFVSDKPVLENTQKVSLTASQEEQHPSRVISLSSTWSYPVSWVFLFSPFPPTLSLACPFFFFLKTASTFY